MRCWDVAALDRERERERERERLSAFNAPGPGGIFDCQDTLLRLCFFAGDDPCWRDMTCMATHNPHVTACQYRYKTDDECTQNFPNMDVACWDDYLVYPYISGTCRVPG